LRRGQENALSEGRDGLSALRYGRSTLITTKWEAAMAEGDQEKRREAARKAAAAKSPEARREAALKGAATRKRNREAKTSVGEAPGL
jgi:hypothetical protein